MGQERVYSVTHAVAIDAVATLETCGQQPKNMADPATTLAGHSSLFAKSILDKLLPTSSGQSIHQLRVPLHKSESSLAVTRALFNELGQWPMAHGLQRASKSPKTGGVLQPPRIPFEAFAFGSAMVSRCAL